MGPPLLIVAPSRFHAALAPYLAHKQTRLSTEIVALETVLAHSPGVDDPEKLKRFLYERWSGPGSDGVARAGLGYVLLVGDADALPVRYMVLDRVTPAAFNYAFYPSDLYYADLAKPDGSFEDWNAQKGGTDPAAAFHAGYFGEVRGEAIKTDPINYDSIDYKPEIAVGRWPVSTAAEVAIVAAKSIAYEAGVEGMGEAHAAPRAAVFAVGGWIENRPMMDALAGALPGGWSIEKRYFGNGSPPPSEAQAVELLNSGVLLMLHSGHGAGDRWEGSLSTASIPKLHNAEHLPVILSAGCSTARFATLPPYEPYTDVDGRDHAGSDHGEVFTAPPPPPAPYQTGARNGTGLGEQLLRAGPNGAVAYFGCNTGSQPCGMTLLAGFVDTLSTQSRGPGVVTIGDCWIGAVSYYYDHEHLATLTPDPGWYPASIFFQGMKFMLFGDPSLPMPAPGAVGK